MQFSEMNTSVKTMYHLLMENLLELTQNSGFQLFPIFSLGGGDGYLVISRLLTTFQFPWAACASESSAAQ